MKAVIKNIRLKKNYLPGNKIPDCLTKMDRL